MRARVLNPGVKEATAIVTNQMFGFWAGVNPATGEIIDTHHELFGQNIKDKVFVFPEGRGSTVGAAVILELARCGAMPAAIVNRKTEGILAAGAIMARKFYGVDMPIVDSLTEDEFKSIKTGDKVLVDGDRGEVRIL